MSTQTAPATATKRWQVQARLGATGVAIFFAASIVTAALTPGYRSTRDQISALAALDSLTRAYLQDELLGQQANAGGRTKARTAYLHVDYRKIAPIGVPLALEAAFEREVGRKRYLRGSARAGDDVVIEAHGLFVELRPGQP